MLSECLGGALYDVWLHKPCRWCDHHLLIYTCHHHRQLHLLFAFTRRLYVKGIIIKNNIPKKQRLLLFLHYILTNGICIVYDHLHICLIHWKTIQKVDISSNLKYWLLSLYWQQKEKGGQIFFSFQFFLQQPFSQSLLLILLRYNLFMLKPLNYLQIGVYKRIR